ncbi:hypothetical protein [Bradyrhizobium sp. USDA 4451]
MTLANELLAFGYYRVLLVPRAGAALPGNLSWTSFKSLGSLVRREAGTIV